MEIKLRPNNAMTETLPKTMAAVRLAKLTLIIIVSEKLQQNVNLLLLTVAH
jgi:hypothetical protein